jgi:hypothetical protein
VRGAVDLVVDSGIVGVEKPDPRIFPLLDGFGVAPVRARRTSDDARHESYQSHPATSPAVT